MAIMAQWNGKSWEVSTKRVASLNKVTASAKIQTSNNSDAAGSPPTKVKALDLQNLSFDFTLGSAAGVDVRSEYESWIALLGEAAPFYLAGRRFGPASVMLTGVSLDNTTIDDFGRILQGTIAISLTEDAAEASAKKSTATSSAGSSSATAKKTTPAVATYSELGIKASAASVGASTSDKATKKPQNAQLNK